MGTKQVTVWIDSDVREKVRPLLKRDDLSLSQFFRKALRDYLDAGVARDNVITITELDALDDVEARR